jgi:hypothetical protein
VNIAQGFREPAIFAQVSHTAADKAGADRNWRKIRDLYGRVPGGMFGGDENSRAGYNGPRQAVEACGMVEEMLSDEILLAATGDPAWADRCENVAFNTYPASMTADLKALRYLTAPNQPQSDHTNKSPGVQNDGPMFHFDPHNHRCCQHNIGHGWPYFTARLWYASPGDGLAALLYGPCEVRAKVAGGREVQIVETTRYPFEEQVELAFSLAEPTEFPLVLRIPGWCEGASVAINGDRDSTVLPPGRFVRIERQWKQGDKLVLSLPMKVKVKLWSDNRGFASIDHGPLTYSVAIREGYKRYGGTDAWPAWDVYPGSPWNYGLVLGKEDPAAGISVARGAWPADDQPFRAEAAPVKLAAHAKRIPNWQLDRRKLVQEVIAGPVRSDEPEQDILLVPMGTTRLRLTALPVIGDGANAHPWPETRKPAYDVDVSHCFASDTTDNLFDAAEPKRSSDKSIPRFTWWDDLGSAEWLEIAFGKPRSVSSLEVYWFDDAGSGQCRVPARWKLLYRQGGKWKPVEASGPFGLKKDQYNKVSFAEVNADALRLEVNLQPTFSGGILRLRVK